MTQPDTIATLRGELDEAREQIRELQAALRPNSIPLYRDLTPTVAQSVVLEVLLDATAPTSVHALRLWLNVATNVVHEVDDRSVEMVIHRLRIRLAPFGIAIGRARGQGFYLDAENKARLRALRIGG